MTSITSWWDSFITALLKPFIRVRDAKLKLLHTIEIDKLSYQQRQLDAILEAQETLAKTMTENVKETTSVMREWLEGFHKVSSVANAAPPVNDDERMWKLELQALAKERGAALTSNMSPYELEALVREGLHDL